jgi:LacI family transcriptional regulator
MEKKNATVKDVAQKAGVSTATVSRVLNGDKKVKPETAQLVKETITQLGYRMNRVARSLKTNKTHTIGIIAPEFSNEFFMNLVSGIEDEIKKEGYSVILCSSRENRDEEEAQLALLIEKNVDGIIIIPGSSRGSHFESAAPTPLVLVDRLTSDYPCDAVLADNFTGAFEAVYSVVQKGTRRVGFIGGDRQLSTARERYDGYAAALAKGDLPLRQGDILFGDYHSSSGYNLMKKLMESTEPPRYIFISNYFMHLGAAQYLLERTADRHQNGRERTDRERNGRERQALKDLHIISFDDMPLASFFPYSSLIVAQPMVEMGHRAARLLLERIGGNREGFPRVIRLATSQRIPE